MAFVAQDAHNLGGECLIQEPNDGFSIGTVARGHSPLFDVLTRTSPQSLDIGNKWLVRHARSFLAKRMRQPSGERVALGQEECQKFVGLDGLSPSLVRQGYTPCLVYLHQQEALYN